MACFLLATPLRSCSRNPALASNLCGRRSLWQCAKAPAAQMVTSASGSRDTFPPGTLVNDAGEVVNTSTLRSCVIFLYPRANTPGCTTQACGMRENYEQLQGAGYEVYGLSYDSPNSQRKWKEKQQLPYVLLSDSVDEEGNSVINSLGCHKITNSGRASVVRSHVIVADDGHIIDKHVKISPADSVAQVLQFCKDNPIQAEDPIPSISGAGGAAPASAPPAPTPALPTARRMQTPPAPPGAERTELLRQMSILLQMLRDLNEEQKQEHLDFLNDKVRIIKEQLEKFDYR